MLFRDSNLRIIYGVTLMAVMGVAVIAPALPRMAQDLALSLPAVGLLITAFTVPGVVLSPILGVLADRHGRRRVLVPSLVLFSLAGGACALAPDFKVLLILRFLQGVGAASLGALNVTLIGDLFTGRDRATAMGYNASVLSVGTGAYPLVGGALAEVSWRYPFLLALLALPVAWLVRHRLTNPEPCSRQPLRDYLQDLWTNVRQREVLGLFSVSVAIFILLYGSILTYFPLLLDREFRASPTLIGLLISSMSLFTALAASQLGRLSRYVSARNLILLSFVIFGLALLLIPLLPVWPALFLPALLFGTAMGLSIPSLQTLLADLAPTERRAAFLSLNGMVLRLGQTLGPVAMGGMFAWGGMAAPFFGGALLAGAMVAWVVVTVRFTGSGQDSGRPDDPHSNSPVRRP